MFAGYTADVLFPAGAPPVTCRRLRCGRVLSRKGGLVEQGRAAIRLVLGFGLDSGSNSTASSRLGVTGSAGPSWGAIAGGHASWLADGSSKSESSSGSECSGTETGSTSAAKSVGVATCSVPTASSRDSSTWPVCQEGVGSGISASAGMRSGGGSGVRSSSGSLMDSDIEAASGSTAASAAAGVASHAGRAGSASSRQAGSLRSWRGRSQAAGPAVSRTGGASSAAAAPTKVDASGSGTTSSIAGSSTGRAAPGGGSALGWAGVSAAAACHAGAGAGAGASACTEGAGVSFAVRTSSLNASMCSWISAATRCRNSLSLAASLFRASSPAPVSPPIAATGTAAAAVRRASSRN